MHENANLRPISLLSAVAVGLIALFSFAISYMAQRELAAAAGIHPWLSYIFPLVIDGFIVVASLSVLRNSLVGESSIYQWAMVALFTILSVIFNAAHAYDVLLDMTFFGLPVTLIPHVAMPVALFFGFEMLMRQVRNAIEREGAIKRLADLNGEFINTRSELDLLVNEKQVELERLNIEVRNLEQQRNNLRSEIEGLRKEKQTVSVSLTKKTSGVRKGNTSRTGEKKQALASLVNFYRLHPTATLSEAGRIIQRSKATVSHYLDELERIGVVHRNSSGVQITEGENSDG